MGWEKRGKSKCYYRSVRRGRRVRKVYCGGGLAGRAAANADVQQREQLRAAGRSLQAEVDRWDEMMLYTKRMLRMCELIATASLLLAGYHRPSRHRWRARRNGHESQIHSGGGVLQSGTC